MAKEYYSIILIGSFILLLAFDLRYFLNLLIKFQYLETKLILLMIVSLLYSTFVVNPVEFQKVSAIPVWISYIILITIYFYILPKVLLSDKTYLNKFLQIISNFGFFFSLFGLLMYFLNIHPIPEYSFGMISLINHPNNTSMVITITLFPTLYILFSKWNLLTSFKRSYYVLSIFVQIMAQLFTYTRAGMIANAIGLLLFLMFFFRSKSFIAIPFIAVIIPIFGAAFFQAKGFASFISRFYLLLPAYSMLVKSKETLLWGYGLTNGIAEYKKNLVQFLPNEFAINDPHNTYVTLLIMFGLIFTLTLLSMTSIVLAKCVSRIIKNKNNEYRLFYLLIFTSVVSILVQGIFDAELIKADFYTIHYLLTMIGLAFYSFKVFTFKKTEIQNLLTSN